MLKRFAVAVFAVCLSTAAFGQGGLTPGPGFFGNADLNLNHGWTLQARPIPTLGFAVPTYQSLEQPQGAFNGIALDLQPKGFPAIEFVGNGFTWFDACSADVMRDNTRPLTCGRVASATINGLIGGYSGAFAFNTAPAGWYCLLNGTTYKWCLDPTGNFLPFVDNLYSIGNAGARATAVFAVNGAIQTSDEREKKEIQPTKLGLDFINRLRPATYAWRAGPDTMTRHQGVIAQNVLAAAGGEPNGVSDDGHRLSLNYSELIGPLIRSVQELSARLNAVCDAMTPRPATCP